jgi:NitT/TauT family transport system ATP-binding protein
MRGRWGLQPESGRTGGIIDIRGVSKTFTAKGKELQAVGPLDVTLYDDELVSLIGPSGCGKSSLLSLIAGLDRPTGGEILIDGEPVRGPLPNKIGIVFQEYSLLPWRNVLANIQLGLELRGMGPKDQVETAEQYARIVGLGKFLNFYPHELSGGMKQRVAIARSLALGCRVLLMDEPFGALDEQTRMQMGDELIRIHQRVHGCVVLVTHSISEAITLSDRIIVMSARPGKVLDIVPVDLPRLRGAEVRKDLQFNQIHEHVWELLSSQWAEDGSGSAN